ncbi:MAG: ATP-binding protein [Candidatus Korobacteraceae bacterium]
MKDPTSSEAILSEQHLRLFANLTPALVWLAGLDKKHTYFNEPWMKFTDTSMTGELGTDWSNVVHVEDLPRLLHTYFQSFDRRESFQVCYRLRRFDGEYRWILDSGSPRFTQNRSFAGYIGVGVDVTEVKEPKGAPLQDSEQNRLGTQPSDFGRRLIEEQEKERNRIARDLHDDIGQGLATLTLAVEQIKEGPLDSATKLVRRLEELRKQAIKISTSVQSLSHQLHSSHLEYVGIARAAKTFCQEFGAQRKMKVDFSHDLVNLPSPKVSLSLFRVLQEALNNAAKHSGVKLVKVRLWERPGAIHLAISDSGVGFSPEIAGRGLGLMSMRERLGLVNGDLMIESRPGRGTTVHAVAPLDSLGAVKAKSRYA